MRSIAPSPPPARGCWRSVSRRRSPTARRSRGGWMLSPLSSPTAPRVTISAPRCAPRPTCRAHLARLSVGRGGPRDLAGLRDGILAADQALARLAQIEAPPPEIVAVMEALRRPSRDLAREFERALAEQLPLIKRDGGFIREGYEPALDESRNLRDASRLVVAAMQARYADDTGIKALEDPPQQRARLFRRGDRAARRQADGAAAECDLHPSPDAGRTGSLHHVRTRRDRGQDRQCRRPRARAGTGNLRAALRHGAGRQRRSARRGARVRAARCRDRAGEARDRRQLRAARGRCARSALPSKAAAIPWSNRR